MLQEYVPVLTAFLAKCLVEDDGTNTIFDKIFLFVCLFVHSLKNIQFPDTNPPATLNSLSFFLRLPKCRGDAYKLYTCLRLMAVGNPHMATWNPSQGIFVIHCERRVCMLWIWGVPYQQTMLSLPDKVPLTSSGFPPRIPLSWRSSHFLSALNAAQKSVQQISTTKSRPILKKTTLVEMLCIL